MCSPPSFIPALPFPLKYTHLAATLCPGLYLASFALSLHSQAHRYVPEPLAFAVSVLRTALPPPTLPAAGAGKGSGGHAVTLHITSTEQQQQSTARSAAVSGGSGELPQLDFAAALGADGQDPYWESSEFKLAATAAAVRLVARAADLYSDIDAVPEILAPAKVVLERLVALHMPAPPAVGKRKRGAAAATAAAAAEEWPQPLSPLQQLLRETLARVDALSSAAVARRRPLVNRSLVVQPAAKQYNPRYEEGYVGGRDYDPDAQRAEQRRLKRALRKEERGAARELRKDAGGSSSGLGLE
jgi:hypothetical protein